MTHDLPSTPAPPAAGEADPTLRVPISVAMTPYPEAGAPIQKASVR